MADETDAAAVAEAQSDADFGAGFNDGKPPEKPGTEKPGAAKPEPAATRRVEDAPDGRRVEATPAPAPKPEYVRVTASEWAEVRAAAAKTASYDSQLAKAFGTIGNLQKLVTGLQGQTPTGRRVEIPKDAFAAMERDFPELAQQTRAALEAALSGISGTGGGAEPDTGKLESMLASHTAKREIEALEDAFPEWRKIVGAVDVSRERPDPNNPFRKWLATKDAAYQARINGSESAAVIGRAIRAFQKEAPARAAPVNGAPRDAARTDRIRGAVQPRGDNTQASSGVDADAEFVAGFNSR
jgi:hypothetical protein